jgi:glycosyltransferase involved in cell wall biosynthesis
MKPSSSHTSMKLKIAMVVHGRFHAFDLARELINQGQDVVLFTNYPKYIVEKFGIPRQYVRSFLLHGIISRIIHWFHEIFKTPDFEELVHRSFSRWAAKAINSENCNFDVTHAFSGIAEEIFASSNHDGIKTLIRGSAHIRVQQQILVEEEQRSGVMGDRVSEWIIDREEREIQLANLIIVLSSFAIESFIKQGVDQNKIRLLPLGAQLQIFRPKVTTIKERCDRILSGEPLRVIMVGNFSFQKGIIDFIKIAAKTNTYCKFRFVGAVTKEAESLRLANAHNIEFIPRQPQFELPAMYAWGDIFLFTTLQDGYAVVLSQAQAGGLPILATTNSAAPDLVKENETGWILPIRDPDAFIERLQWCHEHRPKLAAMVEKVYQEFQARDWADVAIDFTQICVDYLDKQQERIDAGSE